MPFNRPLIRAALCLLISTSLASAKPGTSAPAAWLDQLSDLPLFHLPSLIPALPPLGMPEPPPCSITAIPALDDAEALSFEAGETVDRAGLTPATARALARFERRLASLGATLAVTSAYRPPAYQSHLQAVWDAWKQLRNNREQACGLLRTQVEDEFDRHGLLASQRPVLFSDHTRGTGFDANVLHRHRRMNIDRLARLAGVLRPDIRRDPVHFRLIAARS